MNASKYVYPTDGMAFEWQYNYPDKPNYWHAIDTELCMGCDAPILEEDSTKCRTCGWKHY